MKQSNTISIMMVFITIVVIFPSCSHKDKLLNIKINPNNGKVLRIYELDIQKNLIKWEGNTSFRYSKDEDGIAYVKMNKGVRSFNTLQLLPNRSYIISVLLQADFSRPAEVNMGIQTIDGEGKL